jgi:hypothetical protein
MRINVFLWRFNMKTIIAKSVLLPFVVAATIPVVTYAGPKKISVLQVSTPHPTSPQGTPPSSGSIGQPNLHYRYQFGTAVVGKYRSGSTGGH